MLLRKLRNYSNDLADALLARGRLIPPEYLVVAAADAAADVGISRNVCGMLRAPGGEKIAVSITLVHRNELVELRNGTPRFSDEKCARRFQEIEALFQISDRYREQPAVCPCPLFFGASFSGSFSDEYIIKIVTEVLPVRI